MNSNQRRKSKRSNLKVQRKEAKLLQAEQDRKQPHESERFKDGATMDEILAYAKEQHLKH